MSTEDQFAEFLAGINRFKSTPFDRVTKAIRGGTVDKLSQSDIEKFICSVLAPLKNRLEDILAQPQNANILELKSVRPSRETLEAMDVNKLTEDELLNLLGQAASAHSGLGDNFSAVKRATAMAKQLYVSERRFINSVLCHYANETKAERPRNWVHDLIAIGMVEFDGKATFCVKSKFEAAESARKHLLGDATRKAITDDGSFEIIVDVI